MQGKALYRGVLGSTQTYRKCMTFRHNAIVCPMLPQWCEVVSSG
jgi:hypothetical protein